MDTCAKVLEFCGPLALYRVIFFPEHFFPLHVNRYLNSVALSLAREVDQLQACLAEVQEKA
jgi:hypothetical protein